MATTDKKHNSVSLMKRLSKAGFEDYLLLDRRTAERVLTEKRTELIETIAQGEVSSKRHLAREVGRDISIVSRDLDVLFEAGIIDYVDEGRSKRPILSHKNIFVKPVVYEGAVLSDSAVTCD